MDDKKFAALQRQVEELCFKVGRSFYEKDEVLSVVHRGRRIIWKGERDGAPFAVCMADPDRPRSEDSMWPSEEQRVLNAMKLTGLAPLPSYSVSAGPHHFLEMEWVDGAPLNGFVERQEEYLDDVARAIARLNLQAVRPEDLPFVPVVGTRRNSTLYLRSLEACYRMPQGDVAGWAMKIFQTVLGEQTHHWVFLDGEPLYFHHDGLYPGNVFVRRDGSIMFFGWDKVSFRRNPTYTLVRFAASLYPSGRIPRAIFFRLVESFGEEFYPQSYLTLDKAALWTLLDIVCVDLVNVLWNFARNPANRGKKISDSMHADLDARVKGVKAIRGWVHEAEADVRKVF